MTVSEMVREQAFGDLQFAMLRLCDKLRPRWTESNKLMIDAWADLCAAVYCLAEGAECDQRKQAKTVVRALHILDRMLDEPEVLLSRTLSRLMKLDTRWPDPRGSTWARLSSLWRRPGWGTCPIPTQHLQDFGCRLKNCINMAEHARRHDKAGTALEAAWNGLADVGLRWTKEDYTDIGGENITRLRENIDVLATWGPMDDATADALLELRLTAIGLWVWWGRALSRLGSNIVTLPTTERDSGGAYLAARMEVEMTVVGGGRDVDQRGPST